MTTHYKETTDLNEIAQALKDGWQVQWNGGEDRWWTAQASDVFHIFTLNRIRIAIPPVERPWRSEEVPLGREVRFKALPSNRYIIDGVNSAGVSIAGSTIGLSVLFNQYEQHNGSPCGTTDPA